MKYTIIAFSILLASCNSNVERVPGKSKDLILDIPNTSIDISEYTIEGCQYLGYLGGDARTNYLTHKGNCNNPIHKQQNENY